MAKRNYSLPTLKKMLGKAEKRLIALTIKPCGNWGDGMRLSKLPSITAWERVRDRVQELKAEIAKKEQEGDK
ncbi:MAG: hypothetical protein Q4G01_09570 [Eubacteriales bacterium]|nr:hypothetical protein [Eubacteriales bacterium]